MTESPSLRTASAIITHDAMVEFAQHYDPQPMHVDDEAAQAGFFGQLIASGWYTLCLSMRLIVESRPFGPECSMIGMRVSDVVFEQPVTAGTEIYVRIETLSERLSARTQRRYASLRLVTHRAQDDAVIARQQWDVMVVAD
jgi:acyl dehydratase